MSKIEEKDKELLRLEWVICFISITAFLTLIFLACYLELESSVRLIMIIIGSIIFAYGLGNAIKIEQIAGYYDCAKCHHKYVPTYSSVFWAMHIGRTRYMRCPKCGQKSWQKKVISK